MIGDTELTRWDTADKPNRGRCGQSLPSVSFFSLNKIRLKSGNRQVPKSAE
jgi:hypothetical protein